MTRVRWADEAGSPQRARAAPAAAAEPEDAWGSDDDAGTQHQQPQQPAASQQPPHPKHTVRQRPQPQRHRKPQAVPSLQQLCMALLGLHVTVLVQELQDELRWLPADVKAALLAVARRRGEVTGLVLASLADESWRQLDVAGCTRLLGAELIAAGARMPQLTALDVSGVEQLSSGGWRKLAATLPLLQCIRLGGSAHCTAAALTALPHILPAIPTAKPRQRHGSSSSGGSSSGSAQAGRDAVCMAQHQAAADEPAAAQAGADSWEDAFASSSDEAEGRHQHQQQQQQQQQKQHRQQAGVTGASGAAAGGRLRHLQALVWPDVPLEAVRMVQQRCPRVLINPPPLVPDAATGQMPPREFDPHTPLDEPWMVLVGPGALKGSGHPLAGGAAATAGSLRGSRPGSGGGSSSAAEGGEVVVHMADRFKQAYLERHQRLMAVQRKQAAAEERRALRSSHALRAMDAWLDRDD